MSRLVPVLLLQLLLACSAGGGEEASPAAEAPAEGDERDRAFLALAAEVPARPELATRLVQAAQQLERREEAIVALEKALERHPSDPDLLVLTATLEMELERRAAAEERLRRALQLRPGHLPSLVQLSRLLSEAYRWHEALDLIEGGEEEICGPVRRGDAADRGARRGAALLLVQKGRLLLALGRPAEAVAVQREAVSLAPDYGEASYGLGLALMAAGELGEAAEVLEEARRADPDHLEAAYQAMNVNERLGREEAAAEARTRFEELYRRRLASETRGESAH